MNQADTAWMLISTALVLLMTPALAFFYGGLVRSKNALNTMMMSFISLGFVGVAWAVVGYSLAFAPGNALIGDLSRVFLRGVGLEPNGTIPHLLFMCYQGTFCIITAALISGAIVERMRFSAYVTFITLWALDRLLPGGALGLGRRLALEDGRARLRRRHGRSRECRHRRAGRRDRRRQAPRLSVVVAAAAQRAVHPARRRAAVVRMVWIQRRQRRGRERHRRAGVHRDHARSGRHAGRLDACSTSRRTGKPTAVGCATAIVVGLVAITPAAGFVGPMSALALGALAAFPSYFGLIMRARTSLDDSLDVVAAHGVGGTVGALADRCVRAEGARTASPTACSLATRRSSMIQAAAVLASIVYSGGLTFVLLKAIGAVMPLRADADDESTGMDVSQHGEEAYLHSEGARALIGAPAQLAGGHQALTESHSAAR